MATQFDPNQVTRQAEKHNGESASSNMNLHPKMIAADEIVLKHFMNCQAEATENLRKESRVIVFAQYRDSCDELKRYLERHRPLIKPVVFIGHGGSVSLNGSKKGHAMDKTVGKSNKPTVDDTPITLPSRVTAAKMSQKEQLEILEKFKAGEYNTLVATSIVEEGLDIGDVDLIVCYDQHRSPIRLVQRMGRTGRKRNGRCVMLITEGKENLAYEQCLKKQKHLNHAIENARNVLQLYQNNPRMVPNNIKPQVEMVNIVPPDKPNVLLTKMCKIKGKLTKSKKHSPKDQSCFEALPNVDRESLEGIAIKEELGDVGKLPLDFADELVNDLMTQQPRRPNISLRKRSQNHKNLNNGPNKQRKVHEFFATSPRNSEKSKEILPKGMLIIEEKSSLLHLKEILTLFIEENVLPGNGATTFGYKTFEGKNNHKKVSSISKPEDTFNSSISWNMFGFESFMKSIAGHQFEQDFTRKFSSSPHLLSPLFKREIGNHSSSTPKVSHISKFAEGEMDVNDSTVNISQALDLLSAPLSNITPKPSYKNGNFLKLKNFPNIVDSASKVRYISPIIESLAAAYRRRQLKQQERLGDDRNITFELNFDMGDLVSNDYTTENDFGCVDDMNFNLEFEVPVEKNLTSVEVPPQNSSETKMFCKDMSCSPISSPFESNVVSAPKTILQSSTVVNETFQSQIRRPNANPNILEDTTFSTLISKSTASFCDDVNFKG